MTSLNFDAIRFHSDCKPDAVARLKYLLEILNLPPQHTLFTRTYQAGHFITRTFIPRQGILVLQVGWGQGYIADEPGVQEDIINSCRLTELIGIAEGALAGNEGYDVTNLSFLVKGVYDATIGQIAD